jgi:hypothetical protein
MKVQYGRMDSIQLFEALRQVRNFEPFSVTFVKHSPTKKTGGEIVTFSNVVMTTKVDNAMKQWLITVRLPGIDELRTIYFYSILAINGKRTLLRL